MFPALLGVPPDQKRCTCRPKIQEWNVQRSKWNVQRSILTFLKLMAVGDFVVYCWYRSISRLALASLLDSPSVQANDGPRYAHMSLECLLACLIGSFFNNDLQSTWCFIGKLLSFGRNYVICRRNYVICRRKLVICRRILVICRHRWPPRSRSKRHY